MVGRPQLPLGGAGSISVAEQHSGSGYAARCNYRGFDGKTRKIMRTGRTKSAARDALNVALRDLRQHAAASTTEYTTVAELIEVYWQRCEGDLSVNTRRLYRGQLDRMSKAVGKLRIHEFTAGVQDRHYRHVADTQGVATAKTVRSLMSNVNKIAVRDGAMANNPVREMSKIVSRTRKTAHPALTLEQLVDVRAQLATDGRAQRMDIPFLVDGLMVTGLRISENSAIEWPDVDLTLGTMQAGTKLVVREKGIGLYIQRDILSSKLHPRELYLPGWFVERLRARPQEWGPGTVFPSPDGGLRDPSNTNRELRAAMERIGYPWVRSHTFRRSIATIMHEAGLPFSKVQQQLGDRSAAAGLYIQIRPGESGARALMEGLSDLRATS